MSSVESHRVRVGDHTLALWRRQGPGPPLLLLHGLPGSRATWRGVIDHLPRRLEVLAPDLVGFGGSSAPDGFLHAREQAQVLAAMLDALSVREVHLAGHDFGGPTAILLAERLGGRARSLTLMATNAFPDTPIPGALRLARVPGLGALFFRIAFGRAGLSLLWRTAVADRARFPFGRYRELLASPVGCASTRRILHASLSDLPRFYTDVARALGALSGPALVLWGDRDPFFPVAIAARTARQARARLRVFEGCGHFVPRSAPPRWPMRSRATSSIPGGRRDDVRA